MEIRTKRGSFSEAFKLHVVEEVERRQFSPHALILMMLLHLPSFPNGYPQSTVFPTPFLYCRMSQNIVSAHRFGLSLVDVAEKELGIPIRKKYGAKQSVK